MKETTKRRERSDGQSTRTAILAALNLLVSREAVDAR